jgi:hypothetical protein
VRPVTDDQSAGINTTLVKLLYFLNQPGWINYYTITNNTGSLGGKNTRRDKVQLKLTIRINYGMASIITSRKADNHPGFLSQLVNHLTLAFIPPLGANNGNNWHNTP